MILLTVMITTILSAGFYPSTFLQPVNGSKNSILNWVYLYKYFFVCLSWKTLNRYFIKSNLILRGNRYKNPGNKVTKQRRSMDVGFYNAIPKETYIAKWKKLYMNKKIASIFKWKLGPEEFYSAVLLLSLFDIPWNMLYWSSMKCITHSK